MLLLDCIVVAKMSSVFTLKTFFWRRRHHNTTITWSCSNRCCLLVVIMLRAQSQEDFKATFSTWVAERKINSAALDQLYLEAIRGRKSGCAAWKQHEARHFFFFLNFRVNKFHQPKDIFQLFRNVSKPCKPPGLSLQPPGMQFTWEAGMVWHGLSRRRSSLWLIANGLGVAQVTRVKL